VHRRQTADKKAITVDEQPNPRKEAYMTATYEPQIVAFCCKYCAYAAGDLAGSMRLNYPPNVKVIQVPCTGRVDILHLLRAIEDGADAVYVAG
jgi:F420-non-reducing hydrogenase iron-sulfur subunit